VKHPFRSKFTAKNYWKGIVEELSVIIEILAKEVTDK
jgi:hypothetical protein